MALLVFFGFLQIDWIEGYTGKITATEPTTSTARTTIAPTAKAPTIDTASNRRLPDIRTRVEETITNIVAKIQNGRNPTTAPASLQRPKPTSPQPPSTITSIPSTFPSTSPQPPST